MMTNRTSRAMCKSGNIARKMEFKTICKPKQEQYNSIRKRNVKETKRNVR